MEGEIIEIVDGRGKVIGQVMREDAYKGGILHQGVNVVVVNPNGMICLQRRSANRAAFPLYWDISVSEHLKPGENFAEAALRGLREELSIEAPVKLLRSKHIQKSEYKRGPQLIKEHELVELYIAVYDGAIIVDPKEVHACKFVSFGELSKLSSANFTPWGLDEVKFLLEHQEVIDALRLKTYNAA